MKLLLVLLVLVSISLPVTVFASSDHGEFKEFKNLPVPGTDETFDIKYDVQRKLHDIQIESLRKSIVFTFAGKATNDVFSVILPHDLIQGPFTIWLDKTQVFDFETQKQQATTKLTIPLFDRTEQVTIVGTKIAGAYVAKQTPIINKIHAEIDEKIYVKGDDIVFSGNIENQLGLNHVTLSIMGPKGNTIVLETIPVNKDSTFSGMVSTKSALWSPGTYLVKISGTDASPYSTSIQFSNFLLPEWLKTNAGWWSENQIDDATFASTIQYMIKENLLRIPDAKSSSTSTVTEIPSWVKTNAAWWNEGRISDSDFIVGIQFLIETGIISVG